MKKLICILLALCVLLQPGCTPKKADDTPKNPTQCCSDFIPEGAKGFTFFYSDFSMSTFELQPMSYQADEQKVMQLCTLFDASSFTLLSAEDLLSFSFVSNPEAADFSIWFNSGDEVNDVLLFFQEGVTCRYKSVESDALLHSDLGTDIPTVLLSSSKDEPEYFSVSRDTLHQLQKILIPDFEMGYLSASANLNYIPVEDVNPGSVNEVALYVPPFRRVFPCPDGIIAFHSVWDENNSGTFLRAVKYSKQGEFLWFRDFTDIEPLTYGSVGFVSTNDSGFAFSINGDIASRWIEDTEIPGERKHEAIITPGWLVRCDKDGNIIWQEQVKLSGGSAIEFIFELENGDLLTVGTCQTNEDEYDLDHPTYGFTDLLLMKYNSAGNRTVFRKFGGSDFEFSEGASYSLDVGLVVWGSTQSCDGDITERSEKGTMLYPRQFITVLDDDLNEKWQYVFEGQEEIYDTYLVIADERIYVA
ncbi:MAG: hypothetical protein FWD45_06215, partial [Coriobacteriia bacterium]|nr:hypothetical protein [Coriobacteriia bacterium]